MASTSTFYPSPSISFTHRRSFNYPMLFQSPIPHSSTNISQVTTNSINLPQLVETEKKKSQIWVNPKIPKASNRLRYQSLTKLAQSLNSFPPDDEKGIFNLLDSSLDSKVKPKDGVFILDKMISPKTALIVLKYFEGRISDSISKLVLYNVTLKVFRKLKDLNGAEKVFDEMLQRGLTPDNVSFSTIVGCAQMCLLPGKAVAWFERMAEFGVQPDDATCALMIDSYGRVGNVKKAIELYDLSRVEKWRLSGSAFTTVIRIRGTTGDFDGCLNVFEEMKAVGIKPKLISYNTLLDAICRAKLPRVIKSIHHEIVTSGLNPGFETYASLLRGYCKSHCGDEAMDVYRVMMAKGMELNTLLYNTLLRMCVDLGFVDEAASVFEDMKRSRNGRPNSRTFSSLITVFSRCGKVSEAEATLEEMVEAGYRRDIHVLSALIQCYWKCNRADDVVRTLDRMMEVDPKFGDVVKLVVGSSDDDEDEAFKSEVSEVVSEVGDDARRAYCNCLIDLCIYLQKPEKGRFVGTLL